jgi:hypothetical protein
MDVVDETKEKVREVTSRDGKKEKGSLAKRVLVPLAASAASGATAYAARKLPGLFQEKVVPKLKEVANGGSLDKAKEAVEGAVSGVTDRVGTVGPSQQPQEPPRPKVPAAQRERNQRERAKRRRERKQALSS